MTFEGKYNLQNHMRVHSGELPFECDQCDEKFGEITDLNSHIRQCHTGMERFLCIMCGKSFAQESSRDRHMQHHAEEWRFDCAVCGEKFAQKSHAESHMRVHTELKSDESGL